MSSEEFGARQAPVNVKVGELTPSSRAVNVVVKVVSKGEARSTTSGRDYSVHRVADALVGDETGCVYMNLWDEKIDKVNEGDTLDIKNGYVSLFRGSMRLNVGKYGSFEVLKESPVGEVNTENNLSSKEYEQERRPYRPYRREGGGYGGERREYGGGERRGYGERRGGYRRRY